MANRKRSHRKAAKKRRRVTGSERPQNGGVGQKGQEPPDQETIAIETARSLGPGDLGVISTTLGQQRLPTSRHMAERLPKFAFDTMEDDTLSMEYRLRGGVLLKDCFKINQVDEHREEDRQQEEESGPIIPTVVIKQERDPEYLKWRHEQARKQLEAKEAERG